MKPTNALMLAFALSSAFGLAACNDNDADDMAPADTAAAPAPAPMPAETTPPPTTPPALTDDRSFAEMDANGDGSVTRDELTDTEMLYQHFDQADTDADGKLSQAEVDAHRAAMAAAPTGG